MKLNIMHKVGVIGVVLCLLLVQSASAPAAQRRRGKPKPATVCGDPTATCSTSAQFEPYDLPFRISARTVIWESEPFYAVILKSVTTKDCEAFIPEAERQQAQTLFPHNKVFTSRCPEAGFVYYANVKPDVHIIAVYGGRTRSEADSVLAKVKASGKYSGAYLRRMSIGFNGT